MRRYDHQPLGESNESYDYVTPGALLRRIGILGASALVIAGSVVGGAVAAETYHDIRHMSLTLDLDQIVGGSE